MWCLVAVVLLAVLCNAATAGNDFSMVLVGGGLLDDNDEVWSTIIELGGGINAARFGVISAASEDPCCDEDSSFVYYRDQLDKYGAAEVYYIPITVDSAGNNTDAEVIKHIRTLTGFMFGGGDQLKIIQSFYNGAASSEASPALIAIKETLYASGGVVAGTSAGTDCMTSQVMISGGVSYSGVNKGAHLFWEPRSSPVFDELTAYTHGIGMFPFGILDTHFENRGRHGRLARLLADTRGFPTGTLYGFGVDENTALVVTGSFEDRVGRVIGQRGVVVIDITDAHIVSGKEGGMRWSMDNVRMSHLTSQDQIRLASYSVTPAAFKSSLLGRETMDKAESSGDIFASEEAGAVDTFQFEKVAKSLFMSRDTQAVGASAEKHPLYLVEMSKDSGSLGVDGTDPATGMYWFSYYNMRVKIYSPDSV